MTAAGHVSVHHRGPWRNVHPDRGCSRCGVAVGGCSKVTGRNAELGSGIVLMGVSVSECSTW